MHTRHRRPLLTRAGWRWWGRGRRGGVGGRGLKRHAPQGSGRSPHSVLQPPAPHTHPHPVALVLQGAPIIKLLSSSSSMGIWTSDRNDGDALVELQTHSCMAMIEAPWAVWARCLTAQCPTAARTLYAVVTHPHFIACFFSGLFESGPFRCLIRFCLVLFDGVWQSLEALWGVQSCLEARLIFGQASRGHMCTI